MAPSTRVPNLYTQIIELAQEQRTNPFAARLNLGGTGGGGGGGGQPPGGFLGKLIQTKVAYDTSEASSASTGSDPSLLDNLNHIRARLSTIEAGGASSDEAYERAWWGW